MVLKNIIYAKTKSMSIHGIKQDASFFYFVDCLWSLGKEEKVEGVFLIPGDIVDDIGFM